MRRASIPSVRRLPGSAQWASSTTIASGRSSARLAASQTMPCLRAWQAPVLSASSYGPSSTLTSELRRTRQQPRAALGIGTTQLRLEELAHDAVGEVALQLGADGGQHPHPVRRRP